MPKWLSSTLIVIGFLALILLAILPRSIVVSVTTNVDDSGDNSTTIGAAPSLHQPPSQPLPADEDEE